MKTTTLLHGIGRFWSVAKDAAVPMIATMLVAAVLFGCGPPVEPQTPTTPPQLIIDDSVASDFEVLALETWDRFLLTFQGRQDCFGDVHLRAVHNLDSLAFYDPDSATVTVRVPATAVLLKSALVHEWAHHLEFQCEAQKELRPAFLEAQGLPPETPWRPVRLPAHPTTTDWADIPSEQYAEATIELVFGRRRSPTKAWVTREAVEVVKAWAAGH